MMDFFTIITGLASLTGAIISYRESEKAKKYSEVATKAKNEILDKKNTGEISKIHSETKNIIKELRKIGPTATPNKIQGINNDEIATRVSEYSSLLNEHKSIFTDQEKIEVLCKRLNGPITSLAQSKTAIDIIKEGKKIYYLINNYLSEIKKELDTVKMK